MMDIDTPLLKGRIVQKRLMQRNVGRNALNPHFGQGDAHPGHGLGAGGTMRDDLAQQGS
jgi:hypothetical protein